MIVAMTITNNGLMVFADSVGNIVDHTTSVVQETPNYYYEQETTVEAYQTYLESQNPDVFDTKESESREHVEESEGATKESPESLSTEKKESVEKEETETTTNRAESEESTAESSEKISEEETTEEETSKEETTSEEKVESKEVEEEIATASDAEEVIEKVEEEEIATASEANDDIDEENKDNKATESEIEIERALAENEIATESEANEVVATESELDKLASTPSQTTETKEIIVATISKVSWKVKKVLIATYGSLNVHAKETEKDHVARLATYANIIIVNDKGDEKFLKVNLKWKMFKKYDVNAKSDRQSAPISRDVWRENLKVDKFISEQEEVIISTSNIAVVEERVREENAKLEDKEFVIKIEGDEGAEDIATMSEVIKVDSKEKDKEEVATESEAESVDTLNANGEEISDYTLEYYDLQTIYLYKVDVQSLGDEIIELIDKAEESEIEENQVEEIKEEEEKEEGFLGGLLKLFSFASNVDEKVLGTSEDDKKEETLEEYLSNAKVDILKVGNLETVVAEFDELLLGVGATHNAHQIAQFVNGDKLNADTIFNSYINGDASTMLDLSPSNKRIKATGSNIIIAGTYYLPGDVKISNQWIVEEENTLTLCLNGHNIVFATAGCVRGQGRVVVCNCGDAAKITTAGPHYNWRDRWYATTSETYTKWNEHSLFAGQEVGVYAKNNNISFENAVIKNEYIGRKAAILMIDPEKDEPEYSGDGSLVWGKKELQVYGVKFQNNKATRSNGVAANAQLGKMILEDCTFTGNQNLSNRGGAVAFNPKATIIYNCAFTNNTAFTNGGALYGRSYTNSNESTEIGTTITKTSFEGNSALVDGGAIFMDYLCAKGVTIDGTEANKIVFKNNTAGVSGGAIAVKHMRSVDGGGEDVYSYEDGTSRERLLNINYATFEGNTARAIKFDKNGAVIDDNTPKNENFGGAIYLGAQTIAESTFPTDAPVKKVNINNCTFNDNFAKGYSLDIRAKDSDGNYTGDVLAKYYVGNYGGAIYANKVEEINAKDSTFKDNKSITGAGICVKESTINFEGGELSNGKAYNCIYAATEFYKRIVSPGGGAAYIMKDAHIAISKDTKIKSNENAFYLDGGSIDLGASEVKENIGEYLIGYTNYKTNRILFSGVDIRDHEFNETRKDYASTESDATQGPRKYENGIYAPSYISLKGTNAISQNKRKYYTKSAGTYTEKNEIANLVMTSSRSNLQFDLSKYRFDVPFTAQDISERIGLYYEFDANGYDQIIVFDKWDYHNIRVIDEGGIWTNYFEIDNSHKDQWAEGWKFYIDKNYIRISPNIVQVKFTSYIENVPRIKPQYYNFRKVGNLKMRIATPTEIVRRDIFTPGRTLLGFLGVDKTDSSNTKYDIWDFDRCVIDPTTAVNDEIVIVLLYTNDAVKIKPCGCENGKACAHVGTATNHSDRGTGTTDAEAKYLNYIEVATYPQLSYRYDGRKTQYVLSKDLTLTAAQAREFIDGGIVLNLNGNTLTYDTSDSNDSYIFTTAGTDTMRDANDAKVMICGVATPGNAKKGKIVTNANHKGAFIVGNSDIYLSNVDIENVTASDDSTKAFIESSDTAINSYINIKNVNFKNVSFKSDLINAGSRVIFENTKLSKSSLTGSVVKLQAAANVNTSFELLSSEVSELSGAGALLSANLTSPKVGTKVKIATSSVLNNVFENQMISLSNDITGAGSSIRLQGNINLSNNKLNSGTALIYNAATEGDDLFGTSDRDTVNISGNTIPDNDGAMAIGLYQRSVTFKGRVVISGNKTTTAGKSTNGASAVRSGNNTTVNFGKVALKVNGNNTKYEWYAENNDGTNPTFNRPIFTQLGGTELISSDSEIKIRLMSNSESQNQLVYENWSSYKKVGAKEAEAIFIRDDSYDETEPFDIYKRGKSETVSDIYLGASFVSVRFRIYNYKANVDERLDSAAGYTEAVIQRVEKDVSTLLDAPQYQSNLAKASVMWEAFAYKNSDGNYDYSTERLYPEKTTNIAIKSTRDALVSGYIYNHNNRKHVHEGNVELWTEARNEGHLQATNSFVFLHNDIEVTQSLLFTPQTTYHLCLNGHKLIVNRSVEWFNSNTCKLIICDCQKTGSIVQESGEVASNFINVRGGEFDISDVNIGPFTNVKNTSLIQVDSAVNTDIKNVTIKDINMTNTATDYKSFIDIDTNNITSIDNIALKSNKMLSNNMENAILSINKSAGGSITLNNLLIESNEVNGSQADSFDGSGYMLKLDGYENVTLESPSIKANKSVLGAPVRFTGNGTITSTINMNNVTFTDNQKNHVGTMEFSSQVANGISANFAATRFNKFNINGGTFKGNKFNANGATLTSGEGGATELVNYESNLTVKNVTFDGTGAVLTGGFKGIVIVDNAEDLFENVKVTNYSIGEETFMIFDKGSGFGPAGTYSGRTTFRGDTQFIGNSAYALVSNDNHRNDTANDYEGLLLFNGTKFSNNTVNKKAGGSGQGLINTKDNAITIASGATITNTTGTAVNVASEEIRLFNTEISGGSGDDAAVYISATGKLVIGDKVVVKGNRTNIYIDDSGTTHGSIKAIDGHPILSTSDISISVPNIEFNFFDEWGPNYIEKYNYHSGSTYAYLPSDLFKLDAAMNNRSIYIDGNISSGNQKLWVSSTTTTYATLIFFDQDTDRELTRQFIRTGQVVKVDRVQVDYVATLSQIWLVQSNGSNPDEKTAWILYSSGGYNEFEVSNYVAGETYYAYLIPKHLHKICGPDSLTDCAGHADGVTHTSDEDFTQVGSNDGILEVSGNYLSLVSDLTITQAAIDSLTNRDIVFCLNGYNLTFEKDAHITTTNNFTFVNCKETGAITVVGDELTANSLIKVSGDSTHALRLYNINFKNFKTKSSVIETSTVRTVSENVTFTNILTTAANGIYDVQSGTVYVDKMKFTNNIASGSSLLDLRFNNFTVGKMENIEISSNTYTNKLLSLSGTGNADSIKVENNRLIEGGGLNAYGAIYVANGANITYVNEAKILSNDTSVNKDSKGGALSIYGSVNFSANATFENNRAALGGAIYVDSSGSLSVNGEAYFKQNEANIGAAIYAKNWSSIRASSIIYDENIALTHGVVAFGGAYSGVATFKNHTRNTKDLIYNINDDGTDSIVLDSNTLFYDNIIEDSLIYLRNISGGNIGISYLSSENSAKSFVELATGSLTIDGATVTNNAFTDSVFVIANPNTVRVASISVYENRITNAIVSVSGGKVEIGNHMTFRDNVARLGSAKELHVKGEGGYFKANEMISMGKKYIISAYTSGIKVFEKWSQTYIENYDNPQSSEPGRYMVTPEKSDIIKLSGDDKEKGNDFYKVGNSNNQDIYIGKEGVDFIKIKFVNPDSDDEVFASQNIELGKETKLDKVDTLEHELTKQKWVATLSDGAVKTLSFTSTQTASSSDTIIAEYSKPHKHKLCGLNSHTACSHMDGTNHADAEFQIVSNTSEFATTTDEYVYITRDMVVDSTITLAAGLRGICLNGYTLKVVGGNTSLFTTGSALSICNCKNKGGITTGDQVQTQPLINYTGTTTALSVYNVKFFGINTDKSVINLANDGATLYAGNLTFENNKDLGSDTAISIDNTNTVYLDNITFKNNNNDSSNHMLDIFSGYRISTLSFINNNIKSRLAWFKNRNLVNIGNLIVENNRVSTDVMLVFFDNESKLAVSGDITFENNTMAEDAILVIDDDVEFNVVGTMSFINNTAKKHAAMDIGEDSTVTAGYMLFDGNKNTEANNAIVQWTESRLELSNVEFKNHTNATDILLANVDDSGETEVYLTSPKFTNNKGTAIKLDGIAKGTIDKLTFDGSENNNFTNILNISNSTVSITKMDIKNMNLANSAVVINNSTGVEFEDVNISNNTIGSSGSALSVGGSDTVVKVKGLINIDGNTNNIELNSGSYLKASGMVDGDSKMDFSVKGSSMKLFEGWDKNHIETYGQIASKSTPKRYTYTPENSGLFTIKPTSGYGIYKGGTGDSVSVYAGNKDSYSVLSFVFIDNSGVETTIDTQNVIKGSLPINTKLDKVDSFEYEIEDQAWYAPNGSGVYNIRWEFKNDVISNVNSDSQIKYARKHIHKACGLTLYEECNHEDSTLIHDAAVTYTDATSSNAAFWPSTAEYVNLLNDITFTSPINLANLRGICLNGHKIIIGNMSSNFLSVSSTLDICDCKKGNDSTAAITMRNGVTLTNSLVRVNSDGRFNAYGIKFENISLNDYFDFSTINVYAIENGTANGHVYLERPVFTGETNLGSKGLFRNQGTSDKFVAVEPMLTNITLYTNSPLLELNSNFTITTLSIIENQGYNMPLVKVIDNLSVGALVLKNNTTSSGQGIVAIDAGKTLTLTENNLFEGNEAQGGGVIRVAGALIAEKDLIFKNNTAITGSGNGGALYIDENGKVTTRGRTEFIGNRAMNGAAIYGNNIKEDALKDMNEPYFEDNIALTRGVINWSGTLKFIKATIANHKPCNMADSTGVRIGIIVNRDEGDKLILDSPTFIGNNLVGSDGDASAIRLTGSALGTEIKDFGENTKNNTMGNFVYADNCNLTISGAFYSSSLNNKFADSILNIRNSSDVVFDDLSLNNQTVNNAAVYIENTQVKLKKEVTVIGNVTSENRPSKNVVLADDNSYFKGTGVVGAPAYISSTSTIGVSINERISGKIFEGWNAENIECYDNPQVDSTKYKYVYTPENSQIFVPDQAAGAQGLYKKGYAGDGAGEGNVYLGTKDNYVTLKYYNDVEAVEDYVEKVGDKEYYCYQNIAKGVATKLDKVDTHEYEIDKQGWYVGYDSTGTYEYLEKFDPTNPNPKVAGVNGVVETFTTDQEIKYHQLHIHKVCGLNLAEECSHDGHAGHTDTVAFIDVNSIEDLESATGYAVLARDLDVESLSRAINLNAGLKGICLNGHSLKGDGRYRLLNITHEFTLCNCKPQNENSGITADESFTQAEDIININTIEEVGLYGLSFKNIAFDTGYAVNVEQGNVFIGEIGFEGCTRAGANGVIRSNNNIIIDTMSFKDNKLTGANPMLRTSDTLDIRTLYVERNEMQDSIVVVDSNSQIEDISVEENISTNKGSIYVAAGRTLTVNGQKLSNNQARFGGGLYVAGTYICNEDDALISDNKATEKGGAIYIVAGGKIQANSTVKFLMNEAVEGAAIYAERLSAGDIVMPKSEFSSNHATNNAVIAFGGELTLSNATFTNSAADTAYITNNNTSSATDKAIISSVSVINDTAGKGIILTNVLDGSKVQNIVAKGNDIESLIVYKDVAVGNRVHVTNVTNITGNKFSNAAIVFNNVADAVLNNVTIEGNESAGYGAILIDGSNTKVYSAGELNLNNNTNTGSYGAAITILGGGKLEEDGGMTVSGNRSNQGGAIYLDGTMGVESQGTKVLKVSANYINNTTQTKNILVTNESSYVYATGRISDDTKLGFTAGISNVTVFKYWNNSYFDKVGTTEKFVYTPENSGIFLIDTLSQNAKQEFFKSGTGTNVVIKLGTSFTKLHFVTAGKTTEYLTQNIERDVETKLDKVLVERTSEKWIAPQTETSADLKWQFSTGDINATYNTEEEYVYKFFTYSIVYTGGSRGGSQTFTNIEYGEVVYAIDNPFGGTGFKLWSLRNAPADVPKEYAPGDPIKNVCLTDGGTAYLDARWDGEILITINPNGGRYALNIPHNPSYDIYAKANGVVTLYETYPVSAGAAGKYEGYSYNTKADGSGQKYEIGERVSFSEDITLYLIWYRPKSDPSKRGGGSSGGTGGGGRSSGGTIHAGLLDGEIGPGVGLDGEIPIQQPVINTEGVFTVDTNGNIRDPHSNIVGNIIIGDRVNADGSFTAVNGITIYPNGAVRDTFGNTYNTDGSITTANGTTYFINGDVMDSTGIIYHVDGSTTLSNGTMRDADGIVHYPDGSIMLPDGTKYMVDGTIISPGGIKINALGEIVQEETSEEEGTPGSWNYEPSSNEWKYECVNKDGTKTTYTDQWINTKNAQGQNAWYTVDKNGNMITGWLKSEGEYYFMSTDPNTRGELVKGTVFIDGNSYTFDKDTGALKSGDAPTKNLSVLGAENHVSGVDGTWLKYPTGESYFVKYFDMPEGNRLEIPPSGWFMIDGYYYFFDEHGVPKTGLVEFDKKYYYFNENGTMKEGGEITIGNTIYVFDKATGACRTMRDKT